MGRTGPARHLPAAAIVLLVIAVYLPALGGDFIWDDDFHVTEKAALTEPGGLVDVWTDLGVSLYYPLTTTTFWVERRLFGLSPLPYHAVNVLLHALNALLVLALLRRLRVPGALAAAAIWAVHPVNVESVAWITELKNLQSGAFFFLALLLWRGEGGRVRYALTLLAAAAAMLSKTSTVVLPAVMLLVTWWERGRVGRSDLLRVAPFLLLAGSLSILTVVEQGTQVASVSTGEWSLGLGQRVVVAGTSFWFYLWKVVWPVGLSFIYPRWDVSAPTLASGLPLLAAVALLVVLVRKRSDRRVRPALLSFAYFAAALLPVLGFFDIFFFRYSFVADHFQYLALLGPIALAAAGVARLLRDRRWAVGALAAVVLALGLLTLERSFVFRSDEELWRDTVAKNPEAWMAQNNLGAILRSRGEIDEAIERYGRAAETRPDLAEVHVNVARALRDRGDVEAAIERFTRALEIEPGLPGVQAQLGVTLALVGRSREAVERYRVALDQDPDSRMALNNLAWTLATDVDAGLRDGEEAVRLALRGIALAGDRVPPEVQDTLAAAYAEAGRWDEAVAAADRGIRLAEEAGREGVALVIMERRQLYLARNPYRADRSGRRRERGRER